MGRDRPLRARPDGRAGSHARPGGRPRRVHPLRPRRGTLGRGHGQAGRPRGRRREDDHLRHHGRGAARGLLRRHLDFQLPRAPARPERGRGPARQAARRDDGGRPDRDHGPELQVLPARVLRLRRSHGDPDPRRGEGAPVRGRIRDRVGRAEVPAVLVPRNAAALGPADQGLPPHAGHVAAARQAVLHHRAEGLGRHGRFRDPPPSGAWRAGSRRAARPGSDSRRTGRSWRGGRTSPSPGRRSSPRRPPWRARPVR